MEQILTQFAGNSVQFAAEWKRAGLSFRLDQVVVGTGQKGADDQQLFQRWFRGQIGARDAMWLFRQRTYQRFGLDAGPHRRLSNEGRDGSTHLNVVVVANKRADLNLPAVVSALQQSQTCNVTYLEWDGPEQYHKFENLLGLLQSTDIYVSGIGTGMMWFPLIRSGSVVL
jgi:hypothetical protein